MRVKFLALTILLVLVGCSTSIDYDKAPQPNKPLKLPAGIDPSLVGDRYPVPDLKK